MPKKVLVLFQSDQNDLKKHIDEMNLSKYNVKVIDLSEQGVGLFTKISILFGCTKVILVLTKHFFESKENLGLAKLTVNSKLSVYVSVDPEISYPIWFPKEKVSVLLPTVTAEDIRASLRAINHIPPSYFNGSFLH